jgi:anti-sigma-K factor RskA
MNPEVHTLAGAYALDAVNDIERAEFARHMAQCSACAQEVAELQATAARLADMVAAPPPTWMRGAVLNQIKQTRQVGPWRRDTAARGGPARWRRVAVAAAAAVVVAAGVGAGTYAIQEQRVRHERAISDIVRAPDAQQHENTVTGGGRVRVILSASKHEAVAFLDALPAPGPGHSYQLWLLQGNKPTNMGVVLTTGNASQVLTNVTGYDAFAVSREDGTSVVPTPNQVVGSVLLK